MLSAKQCFLAALVASNGKKCEGAVRIEREVGWHGFWVVSASGEKVRRFVDEGLAARYVRQSKIEAKMEYQDGQALR